MFSWLRRRRETAERVDAEADALIDELGVEAYAEARRREYESSSDAIPLRWNKIALAVAHKTGKRIGLDISTCMAMNVAFAPDRKPQPFSQVDKPNSALALQIQASDGPAAIVAAANVALPPRTIELCIHDSEGRELFSRRKGDHSRKHQ